MNPIWKIAAFAAFLSAIAAVLFLPTWPALLVLTFLAGSLGGFIVGSWAGLQSGAQIGANAVCSALDPVRDE